MAITKGSFYNVPSAGQNTPGGSYGAPTPHAAQVAQQPYEAPASDGMGMGSGGSSCGAFDCIDNAPGFGPTPGEAVETPVLHPGGGWTEST